MFLLAVDLGHNIRHLVTLRVTMRPWVTKQRDKSVSRGQLGLTGPQRERGQEGEVVVLTPGSPEGSAQVTFHSVFGRRTY